MINQNSFVAVFKSHEGAEKAVKALERSGFDMKKLSIVARDYHMDEQVVGFYNSGERMKYWGSQGALWGGLWGVLFGSAFFWIPGMGPILVAGPLTAWIISALEGAIVMGSLGVVGAGLHSIGIPKDSVIEYETALTAGKFVLIANGTTAETSRAKNVIHAIYPELIHIHTLPELSMIKPEAPAEKAIQL